MPGSRYCLLHQSWGLNVVASVFMLIAGAALSPVAQDAWNRLFPSEETRMLRQMCQDRPSFDIFLNGTRIQTNGVEELLVPESGNLEFIVKNTGQGTAASVIFDLWYPKTQLHISPAAFWAVQPPRYLEGRDRLDTHKDWDHLAIMSQMPLGAGSMFVCSPLSFKVMTTSRPERVPMIVCAAGPTGERREILFPCTFVRDNAVPTRKPIEQGR